MRILPRTQREAMFEIYSFCRAVDDIADDLGPRDPRRAQLQQWRGDIDAVYSGAAPPPLAALARAVREFDFKREDFIAIIDGMEMDVDADIRAPDRATLDIYCDRVACAVGRLSVRVFGMAPDAGLALANHLGRAAHAHIAAAGAGGAGGGGLSPRGGGGGGRPQTHHPRPARGAGQSDAG